MAAPVSAVSVAATAALRRVAVLQAQVMFACNNRCWFCLDRNEVDGEFHGGPPVVPYDRVAQLLRDHVGLVDAVMFTHGEPTLHPRLPELLHLARELGYAGRGVVSNARKLADRGFARELCNAGANRFVLSIHGGDAATHDRSVGTAAFGQASVGLANIASLKAEFGVHLSSSTVASHLNLPQLVQTLRYLLDAGVDTAVVNVVRPTGHAAKHFSEVVPRYAEVVAALQPLRDLPEVTRKVVLEDIPACAAGPFARSVGTLEAWVVPPSDESVRAPRAKASLFAADQSASGPSQTGVTGDLVKRPPCATCTHNDHCWGVWQRYVQAYGWDEFVPIAPGSTMASAGQTALEQALSQHLRPEALAAALPAEFALLTWTLDGRRDRLLLTLQGPDGELTILVAANLTDQQAYLRDGAWAWSYRSTRPLSVRETVLMQALADEFGAITLGGGSLRGTNSSHP